MRILHLLASPFFSGPAENVALLALAQREAGHEVTVAVDRRRKEMPAEEPAVPRLRALGLLDDEGLELSVKSPPWRVWSDLRRLRARRVDVVHSHFSHDHFLARWGRPQGAVLVRSLHAPRSIRSSLPAADAYTVPASSLLPRLLERGRTARVLPALVDPRFRPESDREASRRELGLKGAPLVGMVSTFQPSRRHAVGVEAFALYREQRPDARFVLVGDGALLEATRSQVASLGLTDAVVFTGYQQGEDFARWLRALDEVWLLGLGNDWSARAAAQARACGVRVVAVEEGALPELADARVVEPTPEAVVAASLSGQRAPVAHPTNASIAADVLALYAQVASTRAR
ncbi:glycosyltransferase [Myxococcus sp. CA051A]|uniref:Glycosyltransferase n=1 Tax=Myxococcus llanfairpwllgwyngyllgogerychwyrndrobwllllantysiliogogogochensis TaxID=2590453 RepID=A0A540WL65_9BACT|nr:MULTISPECIES: glycosyltransferase [Myxococcus]NTX16692.1 glycosyltransferase [Myxococcus sp. CA056]NTX41152.1 glycosyltransferase [Myxococcus sp. CA033]NTX66920.1 glycosyltransferase [Myxococcus sp. CA051A]TQF09748.1 glycosyltransferase [Myxococcus llanfairpwllgwyngyllgogerychwyrndrobwllllantysiliogogogochensis]